LCYDAAHFSALVTMQTTQTSSMQAVIPITDKDRRLLRLHFASDPGPDFTWSVPAGIVDVPHCVI
jgi:hypothetical protein